MTMRDRIPGTRALRTFPRAALLVVSLIISCTASAQPTTGLDQPLRRILEGYSGTKQLIMLRAICDEGDIKLTGREPGCGRCPGYTSSAGDTTGFTISEIVQGNFAGKHEDNVLVNMEGCEPQSDLSGGMVLLTRTPSGWSKTGYYKGHRFEGCMRFPTTDGHSNLLCSQSEQSQGTVFGTLYWVSLEDGKLAATPLMRWLDNVSSNPRNLLSVFPSRFFRSDFNQDGRADIRIDMKIRNQLIPERYEGAIDAIDAGFKLAEPQLVKITFLFNGTSLVIMKESKAGLKRINDLLDSSESRESP